MGGSFSVGNMSPSVEFNILVDPHAAKIVFDSGLPIVMIPLEVTHTALITPEILDRIDNLGSKFGETMKKLLLFFAKSYDELFGMKSPPLHDPCAVFFVINPAAFDCKLMRVEIEIQSNLTGGQTVCDFYGMMNKSRKNCMVAIRMDTEKFWEEMIEALKKADSKSPLNQGSGTTKTKSSKAQSYSNSSNSPAELKAKL
jgi:inosine-uridine nucleoside N-ribohydrolase